MNIQGFRVLKKRLQPRRFFFRSILMIVLPLVLLQVVVATIFIQRHYEGGVEELSTALAKDMNVIVSLYQKNLLNSESIHIFIQQKKLSVRILQAGKTFKNCVPEKKYASLQTTMKQAFQAGMGAFPVAEFCLVNHDSLERWRVILPFDKETLVIEFSQRILMNSKWHFLLVWMVSASAIFMSISLWFLKNQIRPILHLAKAAKAFGKGVEYEFRPSGAIELRQAGHAFLQMKQRIKLQVEENNLFLAGVSHDLRTVLARVKLGLNLLPVEDDFQDEQKEILQDIKLMQKILDAYLDFAKGQENEPLIEINMDTFLKDILDRFQNHFRHMIWIYENPIDQTVMVKTYPLKLRRCLENILNNACKYGHQTVSLSLSYIVFEGEKRFCITVEDDGKGIDDSIKDHILKPFFQGNPARTMGTGENPQGLGLGLAVTHTILNQIGARLMISSSEKWGGGRFQIML